MESLKQFFSDASQHKKIIITAIAIPIIGYSIYRLIDNAKDKNGGKKLPHKTEKDLINNLTRDLQRLGQISIDP